MVDITIRPIHTRAEMEAAVDLQKVYWGHDMSDIVPVHMLLSIARYGGHVHAAFAGERMVGMLIGFLGADVAVDDTQDARKRLMVMSKRMVVLPEYRGNKIGERLKRTQRDFARQHKIELVTWTFDPLLARNAYLNLHKLAATGQHYEEDYFGAGATHPTLSADRLTVNWWVQHLSTTERLKQPQPPAQTFGNIVNTVVMTDAGLLKPMHTLNISTNASAQLLEIPLEFVPLNRIDPDLGRAWRDHVRYAFRSLLDAGFIATDFVRFKQTAAMPDSPFADERDRACYIFTRDDGTYDFSG